MTALTTLAGAITLRPGPAPPQIRSTRPAPAGALTRGRPAAQVPGLLATVFALCGGAHRVVARRAIAAAEGRAERDDAGAGHGARALQIDTLREHVRRLWLAWPPALAARAPAADEVAPLRDCPALRLDAAEAPLDATRIWVERHALGGAAREWLDGWEAQPREWLRHWAQRAVTLPARLLGGCRAHAQALRGAPQPLRSHTDAAGLRDLIRWLNADPAYVSHPTVDGAPRETGPWTRGHDARVEQYDDAWLRLGARLAELVRLVLPDEDGRSGARWLRQGALALAPGEGVAWCEMARGVLVHRVRLDGGASHSEASPGAAPRIAHYDVLAPTEWNFHPDGAVARALAQLSTDAAEARVRVLAAAFDPCVEVQIERGDA